MLVKSKLYHFMSMYGKHYNTLGGIVCSTVVSWNCTSYHHHSLVWTAQSLMSFYQVLTVVSLSDHEGYCEAVHKPATVIACQILQINHFP